MSGGRMVFPGAVPIRGDAGYQGPIGPTGPTGPQGPAGTPAVVMSVTATAPVVVSGTLANPVVSIPAATAAVPGYMTTTQATKLDGLTKDASNGVPGLTLFALNMRNVLNTFTSFFTNAATAARTWTLPDKDGTVAMTSDLTIGGGGANGRIYYPQNSVASSLAGYKVASLTPSAGATSNVAIVCPTQNAYVLGEEFATLAGEPNTLSLPAGTAIRYLFASTSGGTAQIQVNLFQYKTTGNVATTGAISLTYVDGGAAADTITRATGSFITDGFTAGCKITVVGTVSNNVSFTVQTVAALSLTLIISDVLAAEVAVSTITTKEKLLRTGESPAFINTTTQLLQFFYTDASAHTLAADDRIVFKWWGRKTNPGGSQTITIGTEGTTTASYIQTTLPGILGVSNYVNIVDFLPVGYVTDGSVDYAVQIQNAFNSANSVVSPVTAIFKSSVAITITNKSMKIVNGTYLFTSADGFVYSTNALTHTLTMENVALLAGGVLAGTALSVTFPVTVYEHLKTCDLSGLFIAGTDVTTTNLTRWTKGITLVNAQNAAIDNTRIQGGVTATSMTHGISVSGTAKGINIGNSAILYLATGLLASGGVVNLKVTSSTFNNCDICVDLAYLSTGYGAVINITDSLMIPVSFGIRAKDVIAMTVDGCFFQKNFAGTWVGVQIDTTVAAAIEVSESTIVNCGFGNNLGTAPWVGINLLLAKSVVCKNNIFDSSSGTGIALTAAAVSNICSANYNVQPSVFFTNVSPTNRIQDNLALMYIDGSANAQPDLAPAGNLTAANPPDAGITNGNGFDGAYTLYNSDGLARNLINITGGIYFQVLRIRIVGNLITLVHGTTLQLQGGVNFATVAGMIVTLQALPDGIGGIVWYEVSRSAGTPVTGALSVTSVQVSGGTLAPGMLLKDATSGTVLVGAVGTTADLTLSTPAGGTVLSVLTGTTTVRLAGVLLTHNQVLKAWDATATLVHQFANVSIWSNGATRGLNFAGYYATGYVKSHHSAGYSCFIDHNQDGVGGLEITMTGSGTANTAVTTGVSALKIDYLGAVTIPVRLVTPASIAARSGFNIAHGAAPTTPVNGDMWTTTAGLFVRINGVTKTVTTT